jgi:hypothetical protein
MALTVFKLFPLRYKCQTQLCMRMVHTASTTLGALFFELTEMVCMHNIKRYSLDSEPRSVFGVPAAAVGLLSFFATLSKAGGLILSLAWLVLDLLDLRAGVPGPGTLALSYTITVINVLVVLLELCSWLMLFPKALEHFKKSSNSAHEEDPEPAHEEDPTQKPPPPASEPAQMPMQPPEPPSQRHESVDVTLVGMA